MEGQWYLMSDNPMLGVRRWGLDTEDGTIIRTEYYAANDFMEANLRQRNATAGERFGNFRHVAAVPMHIWAKELVAPVKQADKRFISKWLNDPEHRAFRTFEGDV